MTLDEFVYAAHSKKLTKEAIKDGILTALTAALDRVTDLDPDDIDRDVMALLTPMMDLESNDFFGTEGMRL